MTVSNLADNVVTAPAPAGPQTSEELLVALTRKVDALSHQVGQLYERTRAMDELKDELVPIARDAMAALQVELGAMEHEFNSEEILHLLRQLLRSTPRLIRLLERLEGLDALAAELTPLSKEVLRDLVDRLQQWDERGYFKLAQSGLGLVDRLAEQSAAGELDWLADNLDSVLATAKLVARPEVQALAQGALSTLAVGDDETAPAELGLWGMAPASRDPDVRRGLGVLVQTLQQIGAARRGNAALGGDTNHPPLLEDSTSEG